MQTIDNVSVASLLLQFYDQLHTQFGKQNWWPADTSFEVVIGAILTQNTNWKNVEKAIRNLRKHDLLNADALLHCSVQRIAEFIRPCGYYNLKTARLVNATEWWQNNIREIREKRIGIDKLRKDLLTVKGIGQETADCILLYALDYPSFVVDAYTKRFLLMHKLISKSAGYHDIRLFFETNLPREINLYKEFHALIVALGKSNCKTKPLCGHCPLSWHLN